MLIVGTFRHPHLKTQMLVLCPAAGQLTTTQVKHGDCITRQPHRNQKTQTLTLGSKPDQHYSGAVPQRLLAIPDHIVRTERQHTPIRFYLEWLWQQWWHKGPGR